jgi:uncharacterized protein
MLDLTELRLRRPQAIVEAAAARERPEGPPRMIVAADHPARASLSAGGRRLAMADRGDLLDRLCVALSRPGVDGVLGTPDILEDLLLLGALDGKSVFGSMNRGGLAGASWGIDDRYTAYDAAAIAAARFEGGKLLLRIELEDPATAGALDNAARAVSELAGSGLVAMVEPFFGADGSPEAAIHAIAVASGLGTTSAYTWLKVPVVDEMERVMAASTLPAWILGGAGEAAFAEWERALALPTVQGLVVGRSLLYPHDDDVAAAVDIAASLTGAMA